MTEKTMADAKIDPLHPNGRCRCAGEGHCEWCQRTEALDELDGIAEVLDTAGVPQVTDGPDGRRWTLGLIARVEHVIAERDEARAEVEERDVEPIPDGKYQVNVERVEMTPAQTSGYLRLKWTLRIIAPRFRGRLLWRKNVMATSENIKWLKADLHTCGLDLEKLSDLPANLEKLIGVKLEVSKRTRGGDENIYFNRRIVLEDGGDDYDAAAKDALAGEGEAKRCAWTYDEAHFAWDTECGEKWILEDGGPNENRIRFCHGCGKPVEVAPMDRDGLEMEVRDA